MSKTVVVTILACMAYAAIDVVSQQAPVERAITFDRDRDVSGAPFIVQVQDVPHQNIPQQNIPQIVVDDPSCVCNCDGKCMAAIEALERRVADLEDKCQNCDQCSNGPRLLQSSIDVGGKTVTIRGRTYNLDSYLAQHGGGTRYGVSGMTIDEHLGHHGVDNYSHLTTREKHDLHSALHHAGVEADGNFVVRSKSPQVQTNTVRRSYPSSGGCANGNCPRPTRRFRLFR